MSVLCESPSSNRTGLWHVSWAKLRFGHSRRLGCSVSKMRNTAPPVDALLLKTGPGVQNPPFHPVERFHGSRYQTIDEITVLGRQCKQREGMHRDGHSSQSSQC